MKRVILRFRLEQHSFPLIFKGLQCHNYAFQIAIYGMECRFSPTWQTKKVTSSSNMSSINIETTV